MRFVLGLVLAGTCLSLVAPTAPAASSRKCGSLPGAGVMPTRIVATGEQCARARRLADRVSKAKQAPWNGCVVVRDSKLKLTRPCRRDGFSCRVDYRFGPSDSAIRVRCTSGTKTISWTLR